MRYVNRLLSFVAGAALLGAGLLGAIEAVSTGLGDGFVWIPGHQWIHTLRTTDWSTTAAVVTFAIIASAGVVLFVAEAWPRARVTVELAPDAFPDDQQWVVHRRSLQARLAREVFDQTGCQRVRARLKHRRGGWRLLVEGRGPASERENVEARARETLEALGVPAPVDIRVHLDAVGT